MAIKIRLLNWMYLFVSAAMSFANTREYYQVSMDFWTQINQKETVRHVSPSIMRISTFMLESHRRGYCCGSLQTCECQRGRLVYHCVDRWLSLQWLFDESAVEIETTAGFLSAEYKRLLSK